MSATPQISMTAEAPRAGRWTGRLRFVAGALVVWAVLRFIVGQWLLPHGWHRPPVLLVSGAGVPSGLAALVVIALAGWLGGLIVHARDGSGPLLAGCGGLAIWAFFGGTMDDYLTLWHERPGPGTAAPYAALLADYAAMTVLCALFAWLGGFCGAAERRPRDAASVFGFCQTAVQVRAGVVTLLAGTAAYALVMFLIAGPPYDRTLPGQVYFGAALGAFAAVYVGRHVGGARHVVWYWPMPILTGVVGLLLACWRPTLPAPHEEINNIPVMWGLARALPVQMAAVGVLTVLMNVRVAQRRDADE